MNLKFFKYIFALFKNFRNIKREIEIFLIKIKKKLFYDI